MAINLTNKNTPNKEKSPAQAGDLLSFFFIKIDF